METNTAFISNGGELWVKQAGERHYNVVVLHRYDAGEQKGFVEEYDIALNDVPEAAAKAKEELPDVAYDQDVLSEDQMLAELIAQQELIDPDETQPFDGDDELRAILTAYGIPDNWDEGNQLP